MRGILKLDGLPAEGNFMCEVHDECCQADPGTDLAFYLPYGSYVTYLELENCQLETLTEGFFTGLPSLVAINLSQNELTGLPLGVATCQQLAYIDVSKNNLAALPDDLHEVHKTMRM